MTKTCAVECDGRGIWASDQSLSILLYLIVGEATRAAEAGEPTLSSQHVDDLRVCGIISDYGLSFDDGWRDDRAEFVRLASKCVGPLNRMGHLRGDDLWEWEPPLGPDVIWRDPPSAIVSTTPIVSLAEAIVRLLTGSLEHPPPGHWWAFGFHDEPGLIGMQTRPGLTG